MAIIPDIQAEATARFTHRGWETQRGYFVTELTGDADQRLKAAVEQVMVAVGYGAEHPTMPSAFAFGFRARAIDSAQVKVTITYRIPDASGADIPPSESAVPHIEVGTSLVRVKTEVDVSDPPQQIITSHKPIIDGQPGAEIEQPATVDIMVPVSTMSFSRREPNHPAMKSGAYVGKMNNAVFAGDPAKWWLCTQLRGRSEDGGQSYAVNYGFQRNKNTWDAVVVYIDPETKDILINPVDGESRRTYQVYETADFGALSLGI